MKKVLLLTLAVLMIASVAMADHLGVYSDCTGGSCLLVPGFTSTAAVVHKFSLGTTLSRWKAVFPAGSNVFSFTTQNSYPSIGTATSDIAVAYGTCLTGSFCVGTFAAILAPGEIVLTVADGQPFIIWASCDFGEHPGTGGSAWVGLTGDCREVATEQSTWGSVKALYR